jgi:hypothetical protein
MTLISFLGFPVNSGSELVIHDYIEEALRTHLSVTQVFAVETAEVKFRYRHCVVGAFRRLGGGDVGLDGHKEAVRRHDARRRGMRGSHRRP